MPKKTNRGKQKKPVKPRSPKLPHSVPVKIISRPAPRPSPLIVKPSDLPKSPPVKVDFPRIPEQKPEPSPMSPKPHKDLSKRIEKSDFDEFLPEIFIISIIAFCLGALLCLYLFHLTD